MTHDDRNADHRLDEIAAGIEEETLSPEQVSAAAARVWAQLDEELESSGEQLHTLRQCSDYQRLIPGLLAKTLPEAQTLLVEDHTSSCIACRKALMKARAGEGEEAPRRARRTRAPFMRYAALAASVVAVMLIGYIAWQQASLPGAGLRVRSVDGQLYSVTRPEAGVLTAGEALADGELLRTGRDSSAFLELADGSVIEMSPRAQISVDQKRSGTTVHLERGNVIVEAAKQRRRKLYVATDDCLVSVTGTVFSVKSGTKGSRISVIEGEVHVEHDGEQDILHPGDQLNTHASLGKVSIQDEIAWSAKVDQHLALLNELVDLHKELHEGVRTPDLRYKSELLKLAGADTTVYFAMPNMAQSLVDTHRILSARIAQSPVLEAWWRERSADSNIEQQLQDLVQLVSDFGATLGDEIVVTVGDVGKRATPGGPQEMLLLAGLNDAAAFRSLFEEQLEHISTNEDMDLDLRVLEDPFTLSNTAQRSDTLYFWIDTDLLAASFSPQQLRDLAFRRRGEQEGLRGKLQEDLSKAYHAGASWLVGADLRKIVSQAHGNSGVAADTILLQGLGVADLSVLIAEHKNSGGDLVDRATLTFDQPRQGLAGMLAKPAAMGCMDFVTPEATVMFAAALKEPKVIAEEWVKLLDSAQPGFREARKEQDAEESLSLAMDLAAQLGGEIAIAIDGPLLPTPAWKIVLEAYNPEGFQQSLEATIAYTNAKLELAMGHKVQTFEITSSGLGPREAYTLVLPTGEFEVHYTFADGYLVAAPSRALLDRAMRLYDSGARLGSSTRFIKTLPADHQANFSALLYQDLGSKLGPFLSGLASAGTRLTPDQQQAIGSLSSKTPASLLYAYAAERSIVIGHSAPEGAIDLGTLLGLAGTLGLPDLLAGPPSTGVSPSIAPH